MAKQAHFSILAGSEGELLTAPESFLVRKGLEMWVKGWNEHGNLGNGSFKDLACFESWPFQVEEHLKIALEGAYVLLYWILTFIFFFIFSGGFRRSLFPVSAVPAAPQAAATPLRPESSGSSAASCFRPR